jgi:pimeloyl-ACP methyl ester carboxylesterase
MRHAAPLLAATCLALAALGALPLNARAAGPSGAFLMYLGSDTLAIERFERSGGGMQGTLLFRITNTRITWRTSEGPDGAVARMEAGLTPASEPPDAPPRQSLTLEFAGDSVFTEAQPGGPRRFASKRGAMPFLNPSVALMAEFATRTMPVPGGRTEAPLFLLGGGGTETAVVRRPAVDSVVVEFSGVSFCFGLDRDGDVVRGRVPEQNLVIERVASLPPGLLALPAPDYSAPPGAPYTAEEVKVRSREGFTLAGTLTRPVRSAPVACVVTITGSGQQDRDEAIGAVRGYRPFREVADALGRRGIAVLRLDDRGVGGTDASTREATTETFAHDIEDALAWLRARPDIDGAKLALLGHSEGGIIAPMVAARDAKLRGLVLMAAPSRTGRRILEYQNRRAIERYVAAASRDSAMRSAMADLDSLARRDGWMGFFLRHDPLEAVRAVRVPVLVLHGETDRQVTQEQAGELAKALARAGNRNVTAKVFPGLNHLFLDDPDGDPSGYARLQGSGFAPPVTELLADWLAERLR